MGKPTEEERKERALRTRLMKDVVQHINSELERGNVDRPLKELIAIADSKVALQYLHLNKYIVLDLYSRNCLTINPYKQESKTRHESAVTGYSKVMQVAELLWGIEKNWSEADKPFSYIKQAAYKNIGWHELDTDHKAEGKRYLGSIYNNYKAEWNKEPRNIDSLDIMLEQESRRSENDKEAWLDNEGIIENSEVELQPVGGHDPNFYEPDPYSENKGKAEQWESEARYIQEKILKGYTKKNKPFKLKDEQDKLVITSYIPRHQRKGIDYNLAHTIEDSIDAKVDIEAAVKKAGLSINDVKVAIAWGIRPQKRYYEGAEWNQYRPGWFNVHMTAPDIAAYLGWTEKQVNASMKKIKRKVKQGNDTPRKTINGYCWNCNYLEVNNIKKAENGGYTRKYTCNQGNKITSLYSQAGDCFRQASDSEQNEKLKKLHK